MLTYQMLTLASGLPVGLTTSDRPHYGQHCLSVSVADDVIGGALMVADDQGFRAEVEIESLPEQAEIIDLLHNAMMLMAGENGHRRIEVFRQTTTA